MENQKYGENESCEKKNSDEIRLKYIDVLWLKINEKPATQMTWHNCVTGYLILH